MTAPTLAHYDPSKPTALHTDASRRKGLGYALLQKHADKWRLIQCGSRFLTETESRYAMVELELLAATWAMKKCRIHLLGLEHFELVVDHKALVTILDKHRLDDVDTLVSRDLKRRRRSSHSRHAGRKAKITAYRMRYHAHLSLIRYQKIKKRRKS